MFHLLFAKKKKEISFFIGNQSFCLFLQFPVYFAFENEETDAMLADVKKNDALGQQATATTGGLVKYHEMLL